MEGNCENGSRNAEICSAEIFICVILDSAFSSKLADELVKVKVNKIVLRRKVCLELR